MTDSFKFYLYGLDYLYNDGSIFEQNSYKFICKCDTLKKNKYNGIFEASSIAKDCVKAYFKGKEDIRQEIKDLLNIKEPEEYENE